MDGISSNTPSDSRRRYLWLLVVVVAAIVMGLPTLRGGFVGGDDRQLVLNHVLVNHPSWSHALELFTIIHRDLYQPIPLLTFSGEFAAAGALGLFDDGKDGAWLFHLTNVLLHAINAALIWVMIVTWRARPDEDGIASTWVRDSSAGTYAVATIAALLFAVHPLQVEVVAWVNGRMMLLSTLFALASVIALGKWLSDRRLRWAVLMILFVALCGLSKVRVGLPLVLAALPLVRGHKVSWRLVWPWLLASAVMGVLVLVNIRATADAGMFSGASEALHGPRAARVAMALACYFEHYVWPTGLAAWYPTPLTVAWTDAIALRACVIVIPVLCLMAWAGLRSRVALAGIGWFFATIASTLPIVPIRQLLAADRYMYLPVIGLVWATAVGLWKVYRLFGARGGRVALSAGAVAIAAALVATSWHVASFYDTYLGKTLRIATLYPETPYVWHRVAWSYFRLGRYEEAIATARREPIDDDAELHGEVLAVIGKSQLQLGRVEEGLQSLRTAIEVSPKPDLPRYRLALALEESGAHEKALVLLEEAIAKMPLFNPGIVRLASAYRRAGRPDLAAKQYESALTNNPYEAPAVLGLVELDIERGTVDALDSAKIRLERLLDWMPENAAAWTDLGVVLVALGKPADAIKAYERALANDRRNATAALNLAQLSLHDGRVEEARRLFDRAASSVQLVDQAIAIHDFFVSQQQPQRAASMWAGFIERDGASPRARAFLAWSLVLSGDPTAGRNALASASRNASALPLTTATRVFLSLIDQRYADAIDLVTTLSGPGAADARARLLRGLQTLDQHRAGNPWTFCVAARLLIADGSIEGARMSIDLCEQRCEDATCREDVAALRAVLAGTDK